MPPTCAFTSCKLLVNYQQQVRFYFLISLQRVLSSYTCVQLANVGRPRTQLNINYSMKYSIPTHYHCKTLSGMPEECMSLINAVGQQCFRVGPTGS